MEQIHFSKHSELVVDRIEGDLIVIEATDSNAPESKPQYINLPLSLFEGSIEEGMKVQIEKETSLRCTITFLAESKEDTLEEAQARLNRLKSRSPSDDIIDL